MNQRVFEGFEGIGKENKRKERMEKIENFYYRKTVGYCDNQPVITCTNIRLNILSKRKFQY